MTLASIDNLCWNKLILLILKRRLPNSLTPSTPTCRQSPAKKRPSPLPLQYHYELTNSLSTHWVMIHYCHSSFWCSNYFKFGQWLPLQAVSSIPLGYVHISLWVFSYFSAQTVPRTCTFPASDLESAICPRNLVSSKGKWYSETKVWRSGVLIVAGLLLLLAPFGEQS